MICDVSCKCGTVKGNASLFMPKSKEFKPVLSWDIFGAFYLKKSDLICVSCSEPVLTKGDWK